MRLLVKTNIYYSLFAIPILVLAWFVSYKIIAKEIVNSTDEGLRNEEVLAQKFIAANDTINHYYWGFEQLNEIKKIAGSYLIKQLLKDTIMYNRIEAEQEPFRVLKSTFKYRNNNYLIVLRKATVESEDLSEAIIKTILLLFVLLFAGFFLINLALNKSIWKPFNRTLAQLHQYEIKHGKALTFEPASIKEFDDLNSSLALMTQKLAVDFNSQKQFTENAAHEMQTPLAIIKSKIELLIQSDLKENDMEIIQSLYGATDRLSHLNKALLLLSKIENDQFKDVELIKLSKVINRVFDNYEDMLALKNIGKDLNIIEEVAVKMNPALCDILLSNLILNAIKHNIEDGMISVNLLPGHLTVTNSGKESPVDNNEMFERFRKANQSSESLGLGLSIVKEIVNLYGFNIQYDIAGTVHSFSIRF